MVKEIGAGIDPLTGEVLGADAGMRDIPTYDGEVGDAADAGDAVDDGDGSGVSAAEAALMAQLAEVRAAAEKAKAEKAAKAAAAASSPALSAQAAAQRPRAAAAQRGAVPRTAAAAVGLAQTTAAPRSAPEPDAAAGGGALMHPLPMDGGALAAIGGVDLAAEFAKHAGRGLDFGQRDLIIPRITLLQDKSPEVVRRAAEFIEGAHPGFLLNTVTREFGPEGLFIPCAYRRRFVGWYPRDDRGAGGGLFDPEMPESVYEAAEPFKIGTRLSNDPDGKTVEIIDTPEWSGLFSWSTEGPWIPVAMAMPGTKAKIAGKMNTILSLQVGKLADGREFELPSYASIFAIGSTAEGEGANSYFVYSASLFGRVGDRQVFARAAKLNAQLAAGEVSTAPLGDRDR